MSLNLDDTLGPGPEPGTAEAPRGPAAEGRPLPEDALIILPVRNVVLFPGVIVPIGIGRESSIAAAQRAVREDRPIGVLLQRREDIDTPSPEDLHGVGTVARVLRYVTTPDEAHHVICRGDARFRVLEFLDGWPFPVARVEQVAEAEPAGPSAEARTHQLRERASELVDLLPQAPQELKATIASIPAGGALADLVASVLDVKPAEKQEVLATFDVEARQDRVLDLLARRAQVLRLSREIGQRTQAALEGRQREFLLREQLKAIREELGEEGESQRETDEIERAIAEARMPEEVEKHARKELKRLQGMPESSTEHSMLRTYLECLTELPWSKLSDERIDLKEARAVLDADHFGLDKVKRRIVEFLAVRKLNPEGKSPILCFVGPPGVGKTSLGQSIARATGRAFARISLGGVHDEAEIRGHRRTYVGALPGNILQALRKAGSRNAVLMLDEVDKMSASFHGDPNAALLEVLDPEQNSTFRDNYLGVPFDLSRVLFITTANVVDAIPGPLRDRMEVIEIPGYTEDEKLQIARRYLVARQLAANGLAPGSVELADEALRAIIRHYTREAGVRNLEREIGSVLRRCATRVAEGAGACARIDVPDLAEVLGPRRFEDEVAARTSVPGVATGLAWTPVGGDILFIEASRVAGHDKLILTGQLGDVMKESAQAALTLVKSRAASLGIAPEAFEKIDLHVHVPAGAIPKDGPSAGVAMFVALASLFSGQAVRSDTAMTGEISLRGLVLPVGGIKEKVLAALRAGIGRVLLPARNRKDLVDVPDEARERLTFVWLETVDDAVREAFVAPRT